MPSASRAGPRPGARQRRRGGALLVAALGSYCATVAGNDVFVVCHVDVSLRSAEVREVFVGEKDFAGSVRLIPADNLAAQPAFLDRVLKVGLDKYNGLWIKKSFRDGSSPPLVKGSDAEAISYVRHTSGACSYVRIAPPEGVAVVARF